MLKRGLTFIISGALFISLIGCNTYQKDTLKNSSPYTTEELKNALPIGTPIDEYISKKNKMNIEHPTSILLPNGNVGRVLQASNGYVIICGDEKEIFDILVFKTMDDVINYEKELKQKSLLNK